MFFNNSFYNSSHGAAINVLIWTFFFLQTFLLINSISLCFDPWIFCHPLTNLLPSFWLFLVLFWVLWMLVTMFKPSHVPHASRITTSGTLFMERPFSVFKEWVSSWSHASLIVYDKTFPKKLQAVHPKYCWEGEKEKKRKQLHSITS